MVRVDELASKWKQTSDLIKKLDIKVRRIKENFEAKEKARKEQNG